MRNAFRWPLGLLAFITMWGQPREPRARASDFPVSTAFRGMSIGAEFLAHSVPAPRGVLFAENHLVVEVAIFTLPEVPGRVLAIAPEHFTLVYNGKKIPLLTDSPGTVAGGIRDSAWNRPNLEATGSVGNAGVILGRRRPETGVPDIDDRRNRGPSAPRAPESPDRANVPANRPVDIGVEIERSALLRCECKLPVSGLLFFPYAGKLKSIKSLVLRYSADGAGPAVDLTLIP